MKRFLYIIFILQGLTSLTLSAQVSGYMGKRFMVGYSNNFFIAAVGPTANSYETGINTTHSFNLEYSIKNRTNFCFSFQMFKTGMEFNRTFYESGYDSLTGYSENYSYSYRPNSNVPMQLSTKSVGIGFKFFPKGTLAPVGKYKKLELLIMFTELSYGSNSFVSYDNYSGVEARKTFGVKKYSFNTFAFTYTIGRQRVFFDCLVFDYGMQIGVVPAGMFATLNSEGDFYSSDSYESAFRQETNKRLFRYQLFNLHLGLGFLAF